MVQSLKPSNLSRKSTHQPKFIDKCLFKDSVPSNKTLLHNICHSPDLQLEDVSSCVPSPFTLITHSSFPNFPLVPTTHYLLSWVLKCPCKQVSRFYSCPTIVFSQNSSQRDAIKTEVKSCHSLIQNLKWLLISLGKTKVLRITAQPCIIRVTPSCSLSSDLIASYSPLAHSPPTTLASICSGCLCLLYLLSGTPSLSIHKLRALTTFTPILKSHLDEAVPHSPF